MNTNLRFQINKYIQNINQNNFLVSFKNTNNFTNNSTEQSNEQNYSMQIPRLTQTSLVHFVQNTYQNQYTDITSNENKKNHEGDEKKKHTYMHTSI